MSEKKLRRYQLIIPGNTPQDDVGHCPGDFVKLTEAIIFANDLFCDSRWWIWDANITEEVANYVKSDSNN